MKTFLKQLNNIFWFFYKLTPKGKRHYILKQGFAGFEKAKQSQNLTKWNVIGQANKLFKPKKILTFHKGKSIAKTKKSNFEVITQVKNTNKTQLQQNHLNINNKGKFVNV